MSLKCLLTKRGRGGGRENEHGGEREREREREREYGGDISMKKIFQ